MISTRQAFSLLFAGKEKRSKTISEWLKGEDISYYGPQIAGVTVNENTAYNLPAVLACIKVLSEDIGSLPLILYKRLEGGGKERAADHPVYNLLHIQANEDMSAMIFRETLMGHLLTWGNAYAEIRWHKGYPVALWPLRPDMMTPKRDKRKKLYYEYRGGREKVELEAYRVLHIPGFGFDGVQGYPPITLNKKAIGLGLAAQEYSIKYFEHGAAPGLVLTHEGELDPKARKNIIESWEDRHKGVGKAMKTGLLEYGIGIEAVGFSPEESELLGLKKYSVEEIARFYRMPLHKIQDMSQQHYNNIEQESINYVTDCLRAHCVRWEQHITMKLILPSERNKYFAEFLIDALMRGDMLARSQSYKEYRWAGIMTADEIREKENMNPLPDGLGKIVLAPTNMAPVDKLGETAPPPQPAFASVRNPEGFKQEIRGYKTVSERANLLRTFKPVIKEAAERVVKREVQDLKRLLKKSNTPDEWKRNYEEFYKGFRDYVIKTMKTPFMSYAEVVQAAAAKEIDAFVGMTPAIRECTMEHLEHFADFHVNQSQKYLRWKEEGRALPDDDELVWEIIRSELDKWIGKRPADIAAWEATRLNNLIAKGVFSINDVGRVAWATEPHSAHELYTICIELDGVESEISMDCRSDMEFFYFVKGLASGKYSLKSDDTLKALESRFEPAWKVYTPPLYLGCECLIRAVQKTAS